MHENMLLTTFLFVSTMFHWLFHGGKESDIYRNEYKFIIVGVSTVCVAFLSRFSVALFFLDGFQHKRDSAPHVLKLWTPPQEYSEQFNCKDGVCLLVKKSPSDYILTKENEDYSESRLFAETLVDSVSVNAYHCTRNEKDADVSHEHVIRDNEDPGKDYVASLFDSLREAARAFGLDIGQIEDESQWKIVSFLVLHLASYSFLQVGVM